MPDWPDYDDYDDRRGQQPSSPTENARHARSTRDNHRARNQVPPRNLNGSKRKRNELHSDGSASADDNDGWVLHMNGVCTILCRSFSLSNLLQGHV